MFHHKILFTLLIISQFSLSQNRFEQSQSSQASIDFKFTTWNAEWLSCSQYGPTNEELQINNVVKMIKAVNPDVLALQEVGTSGLYSTMDTLVRRLGAEWGGALVASSVDNCKQNQGLIYKKSKIQFVNASLMTNAGDSYDWSSGRFPVLYNVNLVAGSTLIPVSFVNIHAKAMNDATSYSRRKNASISLKALLDGSGYNTKNVVVLGDLNDYLVGSQCSSCGDSPYKNFMTDTQNYKCLTSALYDSGYSSPVIDNIIISNELIEKYKESSTRREETAAQSIYDFKNTTSDHVPVSATFTIGGTGGTTCQSLSISESFAQNLGDYTPYSVSGSEVWAWKSSYGATMSGFANLTSNVNEDWLISPAYDLSGRSSATLTFSHALNYAPSENDKVANHTLWVSDSFSSGSSPTSVSWTKLAIPTMPDGNNWTFVGSGNIEIPTSFLKNNIRLAFKYQSTNTVASTWEINELNIDAACANAAGVAQLDRVSSKITIENRHIIVENSQPLAVAVTDIMGRILFSNLPAQGVEIPVLQSGIYGVRTGNKVYKVVVR